jgi:hypothetical protein
MVPQLRLLYGNVLVKKGEPSRAADQYKEALRIRPGFLPALQALDKIQARGTS